MTDIDVFRDGDISSGERFEESRLRGTKSQLRRLMDQNVATNLSGSVFSEQTVSMTGNE